MSFQYDMSLLAKLGKLIARSTARIRTGNAEALQSGPLAHW
jgi:hypothetical protein